MIGNKRVVVVLPAYNAERTLEQTYREIPFDVVDDVILIDDASADQTVALARRLGITTIVHERNLGYGANQKTCYRAALERGADIVVMLHADYQYTPRLIPAMAYLLGSGEFDARSPARCWRRSRRARLGQFRLRRPDAVADSLCRVPGRRAHLPGEVLS